MEWIGSVPLHVCHFWIVLSYCNPGSPQFHVLSAIFRSSLAASFFSSGLPEVTALVHHSRPETAACMNSSLTRTDRFSFWNLTLAYASPLNDPS